MLKRISYTIFDRNPEGRNVVGIQRLRWEEGVLEIISV
jgi:hypothetical protein